MVVILRRVLIPMLSFRSGSVLRPNIFSMRPRAGPVQRRWLHPGVSTYRTRMG